MPIPAKRTTYRGLRKTIVSVFCELVSIWRPHASYDKRVSDGEAGLAECRSHQVPGRNDRFHSIFSHDGGRKRANRVFSAKLLVVIPQGNEAITA